LPVSATRDLALTGPITATGVEYSTAAPKTAARAGAASRTAGPSKIPPSGTGTLAPGVLAVTQPAPGLALAAGTTLPLRVTFRPAHRGPVVASLDIPTSAGTRS